MLANRIAKVGLGVTLGCVIAGAVAGVLCLSALGLILAGPRELFTGPDLFGFAALTGGFCGLVVGPLAAFGFLRRVPLGRLFVETAVGATLGGLLGAALPLGFPEVLVVSVGGFAVAVANLARRFRATRAPAERALAQAER